MAQVRIDGFNKLVRDFKRAGGDVEDVKDALAPAGAKVAKKAEQIVPVKSGDLKDSIRVSRAQRSVTVRAGNAKAYYAPFVSYSSARGKTPTPFLQTALARTDITSDVYRAVDAILRKSGL